MSRTLLAILWFLLWGAAVCYAASPNAPNRFALLIGNSNYQNLPLLASPANDARMLAAELARNGFAVDVIVDADEPKMRAHADHFVAALTRPDTIGIFYYAGHALQISGHNHLLPVSAEIVPGKSATLASMEFDEFLGKIQLAPSRAKIVIIDASHPHLIEKRFHQVGIGLAPVTAPANTFVAFDAAPGQVTDSSANAHGPFAAALARTIVKPGNDIAHALEQTRVAVVKATNGLQVPWTANALPARIALVSTTAVPPVTKDVPPTQEDIRRQKADTEARQQAEADAARKKEEVARREVESRRQQAEMEARRLAEAEAARLREEAVRVQEAQRQQAELEARRQAADEQARRQATTKPATGTDVVPRRESETKPTSSRSNRDDPGQLAKWMLDAWHLWGHAINDPSSLLAVGFQPDDQKVMDGLAFFLTMSALSLPIYSIVLIRGSVTGENKKIVTGASKVLSLLSLVSMTALLHFPFSWLGGTATFYGSGLTCIYSLAPYIPIMSVAFLLVSLIYPKNMAGIVMSNKLTKQQKLEQVNVMLRTGSPRTIIAATIGSLAVNLIWSCRGLYVLFWCMSYAHNLGGWRLFGAIICSVCLLVPLGFLEKHLRESLFSAD